MSRRRLTPEEREARIKAYEEAKAARKAVRLEKRKARIEAYERKKEVSRRGIKSANLEDSTKVGRVKRFPTYKGQVAEGDEIGFRWLGIAMSGILKEIKKVKNYRIRENGEEETGIGFTTYYVIKDSISNIFYPIKREDILAKKVNNKWIDSCN